MDQNPNQYPAADPNAAPDPNAQAPQDPNTNLPQGMAPNTPAQQSAPAPQGQPGKSPWLWILLVILILAIAGGAVYYFFFYKKASTTTTTTTTTTPAATNETSDIEDYYDGAKTVEPTGEKAIAVNAELLPVLETVFTDVKLNDETGQMLTYVVKREIVAADVTGAKTELEKLGYTSADSTEDQLTMTKAASTWVITFGVGDTEKATVEITF